MGGQWDGWLDGWLGGWMAGWLGGWMDGWLGTWVDGWMDRFLSIPYTVLALYPSIARPLLRDVWVQFPLSYRRKLCKISYFCCRPLHFLSLPLFPNPSYIIISIHTFSQDVWNFFSPLLSTCFFQLMFYCQLPLNPL